MATTERGDALRVRSRLQFSQPSQPTPSQALSSALGACRLNVSQVACALEDRDVVMSQPSLECPPAPTASQPSASQEMCLGTQDYITPADQQFDGSADTGDKARHLRSPAVLSPSRVKRPRNAAGLRGCDAEALSQPSQGPASQADERGAGAPGPAGAAGVVLGWGTPASGCMAPPARKLVALRRALSPPCARNVFVDGLSDAADAAGLLRAPPTVSRYKQEYKELGTLGRGNFSKVLRVKCRFDGMEYAAKRTAQALHSDADKKRWQQARLSAV